VCAEQKGADTILYYFSPQPSSRYYLKPQGYGSVLHGVLFNFWYYPTPNYAAA